MAATASRALSAETLGAWLLKSSPRLSPVDELIGSGFVGVDAWCLRRTYRTGLVRPGQPVLLWVSGSSATRPAGLYAQGCTTGEARVDAATDLVAGAVGASRTLVMPVRLRPLSAPVLRSELLVHPELSRIEVLTMAMGSNPSFLTPAHLAALRADWPQVTVG